MPIEDTLTQTGRSLISGVKAVWDKIKRMWSSVHNKIKEFWGSFRSLIEEQEPYQEQDNSELRERITVTIKSLLGDAPLQAMCDCNISERKEIVVELIDKIATEMAIESPNVNIETLKKDLMGYYSLEHNEIVVNLSMLTCHPMGLDEATELLDTIIHEMYHAFQHQAICNPGRFGISTNTALIWERNFENYISPEQNPYLYYEQPVEESARSFAHLIVLQF